MKKIRIYKDLSIKWKVLTNGEEKDLAGRDLTLELVNRYGREEREFSVDGCTVICKFKGTEQKSLGEYWFTLWENKGKDGQTLVDSCDHFILVSNTCEENRCGGDGCTCGSSDGDKGDDDDDDSACACGIIVVDGDALESGSLELETEIDLNSDDFDVETEIELCCDNMVVGIPGLSAYDIWLSLGNTGTEQDFIDSLKGAKGDKGDKGDSGNLDDYYTSAEVDGKLDGKVDKVDGMGLSSNDFTDAEKQKLKNIYSGAEKNVIIGINKADGTALTPVRRYVTLPDFALDEAITDEMIDNLPID